MDTSTMSVRWKDNSPATKIMICSIAGVDTYVYVLIDFNSYPRVFF